MKYTYNGNTYTWIGEGLMKHPDTGDWIPCVFYRDDVEMYARETNDFFDKFTPKTITYE